MHVSSDCARRDDDINRDAMMIDKVRFTFAFGSSSPYSTGIIGYGEGLGEAFGASPFLSTSPFFDLSRIISYFSQVSAPRLMQYLICL
jgi:hypothetical protein